jgi:hypothetical protein
VGVAEDLSRVLEADLILFRNDIRAMRRARIKCKQNYRHIAIDAK